MLVWSLCTNFVVHMCVSPKLTGKIISELISKMFVQETKTLNICLGCCGLVMLGIMVCSCMQNLCFSLAKKCNSNSGVLILIFLRASGARSSVPVCPYSCIHASTVVSSGVPHVICFCHVFSCVLGCAPLHYIGRKTRLYFHTHTVGGL